MRGKAHFIQQFMESLGITPAYAGKSSNKKYLEDYDRDHPRVCGEKFICCIWIIRQVGSPPRMRGKGREGQGESSRAGITPAYAGKSLQARFLAI